MLRATVPSGNAEARPRSAPLHAVVRQGPDRPRRVPAGHAWWSTSDAGRIADVPWGWPPP